MPSKNMPEYRKQKINNNRCEPVSDVSTKLGTYVSMLHTFCDHVYVFICNFRVDVQ